MSASVAQLSDMYSQTLYTQIEITNICNSRCVFCAHGSMTRPKGRMDFELFKDIIAQYDAMGGGPISLTPFGDNLTTPYFLNYLQYVYDSECITNIEFHTNLLGHKNFNEQDFHTILELTDYLSISVGPNREDYKAIFGVDGYDTVLEGLKRIAAGLQEVSNPCTVSILGRAGVGTSQVDDEIVQLAEELSDRPLGWLRKYRNWGGAVKPSPLIDMVDDTKRNNDLGKMCMRPLRSSMIFQDGRVGFCSCADYDANLVIGDLKENTLAEIIGGAKRRAMLDSFTDGTLNSYCRTCSFFLPMNMETLLTGEPNSVPKRLLEKKK